MIVQHVVTAIVLASGQQSQPCAAACNNATGRSAEDYQHCTVARNHILQHSRAESAHRSV